MIKEFDFLSDVLLSALTPILQRRDVHLSERRLAVHAQRGLWALLYELPLDTVLQQERI
jgi:hypothetical protein